MSDLFSRISINHLLKWILDDFKGGSIFGIPKDLFFVPNIRDKFRFNRYSVELESPLGVAAGPQTQMAQNIITAWLMGARYIELKTIQTLDELKISKPCIDMEDEGFNCEWSQELKLTDSLDEYLNAWVIIHVLRHMFGWDKAPSPGFIFNMSVGYNIDGILRENVQYFLKKAKNAETEIGAKIKQIKAIYPPIADIDIPSRISDNVTLSTMHGCPPDEIEKIGLYLIKEQGLHTTIKFNPTLLEPKELRDILNRIHGFKIEVPDEAFRHDLRFDDAIGIIARLRQASEDEGLQFSIKLTNTLETINKRGIFPEKEKMAYMSGRPLHPISINVANKIQQEFNGELDISFSGGADCFNIVDIISCGLKPVTISSDLLKPAGYGRMSQYLSTLKRCDKTSHYLKDLSPSEIRVNLAHYASKVKEYGAYSRTPHSHLSIKTERKLPPFDCVIAPCTTTCPSNQAIPEYMRAVAAGKTSDAYEIVLRDNPFPHVTGMVCDQVCQTKCTRLNFDQPLMIREIKRYISENKCLETCNSTSEANGRSVAIIGAGPSGLAAAYFLRLKGFTVNVYEAKDVAGGMVSHAIPDFRLSGEAICHDIKRIEDFGVNIHYGTKITQSDFHQLKSDNDYLYVAVGAQKAKKLGLENEEAGGVIDQLQFLSAVKTQRDFNVGSEVVVVGGGNSAMDAARTALRLIPKTGKVTVIYRRTKNEMPADIGEISALLAEGCRLMELTAPAKIIAEGGKISTIRCHGMVLSDTKDASGRRKPVKVAGSEFDLNVDTLIPAIGQDISIDFLKGSDLTIDPKTLETNIDGIFLGGDSLNGAATIIAAIADGKRVAKSIAKRAGIYSENASQQHLEITDSVIAEIERRASMRIKSQGISEIPLSERNSFNLVIETLDRESAIEEASRCLSCDIVCNTCVTVCPNRANVAYRVKPSTYNIPILEQRAGECSLRFSQWELKQRPQVANIGDFCNECGNCTTFCPTSGAPYRDKPKLYLTRASFEAEKDGFYLNSGGISRCSNGKLERLTPYGNANLVAYESELLKAYFAVDDFSLKDYSFKSHQDHAIELKSAFEMYILFRGFLGAGFIKD